MAANGPSGTLRALVRRIAPLAATALVFALIFRRIPIERLWVALQEADYAWFLALMIPNTLLYFCWDTLILATAIRWFHGSIPFSALLPARAVSYVVALFNSNLARGTLAAYLARRLGEPFLQLGSTVIFLLLTEYVHLVAWAFLGLVAAGQTTPPELLWLPPVVAALWLLFIAYTRFNVRPWDVIAFVRQRREWPRETGGIRQWSILRTFRIAPLSRYAQMVLLRAPIFFVSLVFHYFAAHAFGIEIPFGQMIAFLPVIFMIAALPITVAHLGTTQAAWVYFFSAYAAPERLLAFSLAAHATFTVTRALLGLAFTPMAYTELVQHSPVRDLVRTVWRRPFRWKSASSSPMRG
jgi:uncharacterized membrane protein YbhN (UPF0104 family)